MNNKDLKFRQKARSELLKGVELLADAVTTTLGAKGRNVVIEIPNQAPLVVHDGVTVAKQINLKNKHQNLGANLVKEAASKTNDKAGDGTTTATLLAHTIVREGMKYLDEGENPMQLRDELKELTKNVIDELKKTAKPIKTEAEITQVATVSAASEEIGKIVGEAVHKVGESGVVIVEPSQETEITVDYKEGMEFENGFLSPYFVTDHLHEPKAEVKKPHILITDKKIVSMDEDFINFLNYFIENAGQEKNLVIIADEVSGEALAGLIVNRLRGVINVSAVKAPGFGAMRGDYLEDIAILTGGAVIKADEEKLFASVTIEDLGQADKIVSTKDTTKIVGGKGSRKKVADRVKLIESYKEKAKTNFEKGKFEERVARLNGKVAVINVGATTEIELKDLYERVVDAVGAAQAAVEEGIIAGGGIVLYRLSQRLDESDVTQTILKKALQAPIYKILENAGIKQDARIIRKLENLDIDYGFDVLTEEWGDMIKMGIIDPVKVTRLALENAVAVAGTILTADVTITEDKDENKPATG